MRPVIKVEGAGNFEKFGEIRQINEAYHLFDGIGNLVATCPRPQPLATFAFDCGAISVHHNYDLRAAEGYENRKTRR